MTRQVQGCAVYTRKSSEEGLDQDFNSLQAQREACIAFIASQTSLGWKLIRKLYDDGGLSGGSMERPALQELLSDIQAGRIQIVVVYKIDRLTRSLMDFARMVEIFDRHQVSFVSVTQQFNTTTSMGRLTLNVLLSFAQFEREITAERIRDKIAASKQKGMWMGGPVAMGYRVEDRELRVETTEAALVQRIYDLYLDTRSVRVLKANLDQAQVTTPERRSRSGRVSGGKPFTRGHLYWLLSNPLYVGRIRHHGKVWPGRHPGLIDVEIWDQVQATLAEQAPKSAADGNGEHTSLLAGLLFDETGDRLTPSHATRRNRRYRYYISTRLVREGRQDGSGWRLPARQVETPVLSALTELLSDPPKLLDGLDLRDLEPHALRHALARAKEVIGDLKGGNELARRLICSIVAQIVIAPQQLTVEISKAGLRNALSIAHDGSTGLIVLALPFTLRRRGVETRVVLDSGHHQPPVLDPKLVAAITQAYRWLDRLTGSPDVTLQTLASEEKTDPREIVRILPLAFLAPDIVMAILAGRQPIELTSRYLKRLKPMPLCWAEQRRALGFPPVA